MTIVLLLAAVAVALVWWLRYRSAKWRRESEAREAQVLEAIFAARAGEDAAKIDLDRVFAGRAKEKVPAGDDAVLRAAKLAASVAPPAAAPATSPAAMPPVDSSTAAGGVDLVIGSADSKSAGPADLPPTVRDLVRVFYEARGYRATSAEASARPVELVLAHKSDAKRTYAYVTLRAAPAAAELTAIAVAARRIGQPRVLVATEAALPADAPAAPAGVKVYDRAAIEAQLGRIDPSIAARIRAAAGHRSFRRGAAA